MSISEFVHTPIGGGFREMAKLKSLTIDDSPVSNFVIDENSSNSNTINYKYRKWNNGVIEIWIRETKTINFTDVWYDIGYNDYSLKTSTFVPPVKAVDMSYMSCEKGGGGIHYVSPDAITVNTDGTISIYAYVVNAGPTTEENNKTLNLCTYIVGTWK